MKRDKIAGILSDLKNALTRLTEGLAIPPENDIVIDGTIQRFEFSFELSWKLMQAFLEYQGIECKSPRGAIKEGFSYGLIEEGDNWIDMMEDKNRTSHIYDEIEAREIYEKIKAGHHKLINSFLRKIEEEIA
ncbi:MAG: nucleotidyltransferase [Desulfobacterales bacterium]|nr:nucleotidyltransferase [Desulfobacterales bacterium]